MLVILAAGQFLMTLDSSVMNVSIATAAKELDAGLVCCWVGCWVGWSVIPSG